MLAAVVGLVALSSAQSDAPLSEEDGRALQRKIARIVSNSQTERTGVPDVVLWEREINAYLRFQAAPLLPAGVTEPAVTLEDEGRVSTSASVDLEAISASRPRGAFDPLRYLRGVVPVTAEGRLDAREGRGRLEVESASVGGIPVPVTVLREVVSYYTRTDVDPEGFDLTEPFDLPYGVTDVTIESERAVVAQ